MNINFCRLSDYALVMFAKFQPSGHMQARFREVVVITEEIEKEAVRIRVCHFGEEKNSVKLFIDLG